MKKIAAFLFLLMAATFAHSTITTTATGTTYIGTTAVNAFTLNRPSSVNAGDLLIAQIIFTNSGATISTPPAGWTLLRVDTNSGSGNDSRQYIYYYIAASGETGGGSTSWSLSGSSIVVAGMIGFRSSIGGRSIVLGSTSVNSGTDSSLIASSMTTSTAGLLLRFYGLPQSNSTITSPSNLNRLISATTNTAVSPGATLLMASRTINALGATGSDTVISSNQGRWLAQSLFLSDALAKPTNCFSDTFSSSGTFGQNWITTTKGTTEFNPAIVNGRLQLTSATNYISTAATLQRIFPTNNLIYVEFNYYSHNSTNGADGVAVTLSDASATPQAGGFGGSLGYAQRDGTINGFAGGWIGIALDEYGNFSNPTEGRNGGPGRRIDSVSIRGSGSGQTGYAYIAGTAANQNPEIDSNTTPGPGHRYRIIIDAAAAGQTFVTVDRDTGGTGSNYTNMIPTFNIGSSAGQAAIPANLMLSFTGSTGASNNNHEIDNLSICATTINTPVQVDHFEITHDNQGLTCEPENITISACADAACSTLMSVPVDITLTSSLNWVGGNVHTIIGSGVVQLRQTTAATAGFKITNSTPGTKPFTSNRCNGTAMTASSPGDVCNLPFVNAGLSFDVPNLVANKPSGAVRLRAVRNSGDANNSCVALFQNTTQAINFWSTYTTPNAGTRAVELRAGSGSGNFTNVSGNSSSPTALSLTFDANGETTLETRYQDAGLMALSARYNGSGDYAGLILNGSDSFVSTPAGFCVRGAQTTAPTTYLSCTSNYSSCPVFASAGNNFVLNIAAAGWESDNDIDFCTDNGTTPNYRQNNLGLSSIVIAPTAADPDDNINGIVSPASFNLSATNNGVVTPTTVNNVTESEVGVFEVVVTAPNYNGVAVPSGRNLPIGRFIPHHFQVSSGGLINRRTSCVPPSPTPAFTYMNERFDLSFDITAQNAANVTTQNYRDAFESLHTLPSLFLKAISPTTPLTNPSRLAFDANSSASNPTPRLKLFDAINNPMTATWNNGMGSFSLPLTLARLSGTDGPYTNVALGIAPTDADNVIAASFNLDTNVPADSLHDHVQIGSNTEFRYGRLRLDSVSGPANLPLAIPITAEYWNGVRFITNLDDTNCTTITINAATTTPGPYSGNLSSGESNFTNGNGAIVSGRAPASLLQFSPPGAGNEGSIGVTLNTSPWPWLQFDWNGDGTLDTSASATASFGTYRGSDRVIYWQETQ